LIWNAPLIRKYQQGKGILFSQGYGMTEAFRLTSLDLEDSIRKAGSLGKILKKELKGQLL